MHTWDFQQIAQTQARIIQDLARENAGLRRVIENLRADRSNEPGTVCSEKANLAIQEVTDKTNRRNTPNGDTNAEKFDGTRQIAASA